LCGHVSLTLNDLPVHAGRKKAQDALQVHERVTQVVMTASTRIMNGGHILTDKAFVPGESKARTDVDILVIKKIPIVESAKFPENGGREKHKHSGNPVRLLNRPASIMKR
jgi:hypothetical protein